MELTMEQCCKRLENMDDIAVLCHRNPDGDTLGCAFALKYMLEQLGKRVQVKSHDGFPKQYSYMYPKSQPEFEPKFIVAVDVADEELLGSSMDKYKGKIDLCIDHHSSNKHYAKDWYVRNDNAAAAEIMENVCAGLSGVKLTKLIADCIYTGVSTDTGCFRYSNTTAHSHAVAGRMIAAGCDFKMINRVMFEIKSQSRIAMEKEVLATMEYHFNKKLALVYITRDMMERTGALDSELEEIASMPRQIEGVLVGATLRQRDDGYKISLLSGEEIDSAAICGKLGGGGHRCAAGCFVKGSLEHAKEEIISVVGKALGFGEDKC